MLLVVSLHLRHNVSSQLLPTCCKTEAILEGCLLLLASEIVLVYFVDAIVPCLVYPICKVDEAAINKHRFPDGLLGRVNGGWLRHLLLHNSRSVLLGWSLLHRVVEVHRVLLFMRFRLLLHVLLLVDSLTECPCSFTLTGIVVEVVTFVIFFIVISRGSHMLSGLVGIHSGIQKFGWEIRFKFL